MVEHSKFTRSAKQQGGEESMKHSMKTGFFAAFTAGIMALGLSFTPAPAHALSLKVSSDGDSVTCLSVTSGCGGGAGTIGYSTIFGGGPIGNFNALGITGFGPNTLGTFDFPSLDLSALVASTAAGTLTIELSEVGFTGPSSVQGFFGSLSGSQIQSVQLDYYVDLGNSLFGKGTSLGSLSGLGTFSDTASFPFVPGSTYSLTMVATITHTGAQTTSMDAQINAVPEPGTIFLFGSGLMGLAAWRLRKNKANQ